MASMVTTISASIAASCTAVLPLRMIFGDTGQCSQSPVNMAIEAGRVPVNAA